MEDYQPALTGPSWRSSVSEAAKLWGQAASRDDAGPMLIADVRIGAAFGIAFTRSTAASTRATANARSSGIRGDDLAPARR
jgi:hypothetical protein